MNVFILLAHLFIPHHGNDFKPHIFREVAVSFFLFLSVLLLGSSFGSSFFIHRTVFGAEVASSVLIDLTNESRVASHEVPLLKSNTLGKAAKLKGQDMVDKEYFAHDSPSGVTPWDWMHLVGYSFMYAGENLAINFTDSTDVENAWLNSPKHKANILNSEFREIGIATVPGIYNNTPTIYIVQMFGTPAYTESTLGTSKVSYSTWYDRIIFNGSQYIDSIYKILMVLLAIALVMMIVIEIKKQHVVHIIYGISLLLLLQLFIYINQSFF